MSKSALKEAKTAKKDEFYTQLVDIEKEMLHYFRFFKGKTVLCNCDDPYESNFFYFFATRFNDLGLKKLICTCYDGSKIAYSELSTTEENNANKRQRKPYKIVITEVKDENQDGAIDIADVNHLVKNKKNVLTLLEGDGDFRSAECIELLKEADIVVTNPPFSLFREYITQLMEYNKAFILLSNMNAITYKEFFPLLMKNKVWVGYGFNMSMVYKTPYPNLLEANRDFVISKGYEPDDGYIKVPSICWFTNLDIDKRHEKLILYKSYSPEEYPHYDNYDAINVDKVTDIPYDYTGVMGVPITFMDKFNPTQFEILGITDRNAQYGYRTKIYTANDAKNFNDLNRGPVIKKDDTFRVVYTRIFIKHKEVKNNEN